MKKLILTTIFCISASYGQALFAQGLYDGIWQVTEGIYATINQNGDQLAVVLVYDNGTSWQAELGTLTDNVAQTETALGVVSLQTRVEFSSETEGTIEILSCEPLTETCRFESGTTFSAVKIF